MGAQAQLIQLFWWDSDPSLINPSVQIGLATKASRRGRGSNEIEDSFVTVQGMTSPVGTNQVEHPMLNQVPFGGPGGIMSDRDNQTELSGQTLQPNFPQSPPTAIGTTAIGLDQQVPFTRIKHTSQFEPPGPDGCHGKLGGIMGRAHDDIALVLTDVIDPVGDGFSRGQVQKIVHIDLPPLLAPLRSGLLKIADQLPLFGIDTDGGPMAPQISLSPAHNIAKLLITVRRLLARHPFVIDPQRIILGSEQATNRRQADRILSRQGFLDFAQRLVCPLQAPDGIASRFLDQQRFQDGRQTRHFFSVKGRPPPLALIRSLKSPAVISP